MYYTPIARLSIKYIQAIDICSSCFEEAEEVPTVVEVEVAVLV